MTQVGFSPRFSAITVKEATHFAYDVADNTNTFELQLELTGKDAKLSPLKYEGDTAILNIAGQFNPKTMEVEQVFLDAPVPLNTRDHGTPYRGRIPLYSFRTQCHNLIDRLLQGVSAKELRGDILPAYKNIQFEPPKRLTKDPQDDRPGSGTEGQWAEKRQEWTRVMKERLAGLLRSIYTSTHIKPIEYGTGERTAEKEDNNTQYFVRY